MSVKKKTKLFSLILFGLVFIGVNVQAQTTQSSDFLANEISETELERMREDFLNETIENSENLENSVLLATINIYEAEILKQENNKFDLSFLITNREKAQPSVKYAIQLISKNEEGNETVIDEKVYPEVLNLGENSEIRKEIKYKAPEYLNGSYFLRIVSRTEGGLILGTNFFKEIYLKGNSRYIEVLNSSCFLSVEGEEQNKKYNLHQGVDVKSDEILKLNCKVENHSGEDVVLSYSSKNFHRSVFGNKSDLTETYKEIGAIKSKEKKNISIEISKANQPQAYDVMAYFKTDKDIPVNNITAHYVLSGKSASIINLLLDKNFYNKGDQAEISFFYTGPADNFPDSRLGATSIEKIVSNFKIKDRENKLCGPEISSELNKEDIDNRFKYQINQLCASPTVEVVLTDGTTGEVLAEGSFSFTSPEEFVEKATTVKAETVDEKDSLIPILVVFGGLVMFLVSGFLLIKKRKTLILKIIIVFFFSGVCFLSEAKADSYYLNYSVKAGGGSGSFVNHSFTFNYSLNKRTYSPGERITADLWMTNIACWNSIAAGEAAIALPYYGGGMSSSPYYTSKAGTSFVRLSGYAPTSPGSYDAGFHWIDNRYFYAKWAPTSGEWRDTVYFNNKAHAYNVMGYVGVYPPNIGRRYWNYLQAQQELAAYGFPTAASHYYEWGRAEGTTPYLTAYSRGVWPSDFSGDNPAILKTISFTVSAPVCVPNCNAKTSYCSGEKFADSCGNVNACTGTKTDGHCCIVSSWSPATSTVCSGKSFPQISNCGTTQTAWGSFNCSLPGYSTFNYSCSANTLTTTQRFYTYPCVSGACGSPTLASQNSVNESCDTSRQTCADGLLKSRCIDASTLESYKEYNEGTCSVSSGACLESTKECDSVEEICESGYTCKATGTDTADCVPKSSSWTEV
jgi:hypothetical protein